LVVLPRRGLGACDIVETGRIKGTEFKMVKKDIGAAGIVLNAEGHVLLVKQSYGKLNWELPGGAAEANESIAVTAQREVKEETGLSVVTQHMTGVYYQPHDDSIHFVFLCELVPDAPVSQHDSEVTENGYWPLESLPRPISDFTVRRIEDALSSQIQALPTIILERQWLD
jgi:8-oxo-dGTP pyrophosphatase MutT (NUDIX family)